MGGMDPWEFLRMSEPADSRDGRLTLLALLMMMYVIAMFVSVAIHEVLGHGLFTVLLDGEFYAVYLSPGAGFASLWLPQTMNRAGVGMVYMAGIAVQLLIGTLVLLFVMPRIKSLLTGLFALVFCVSMLVHSSMYLFMGYYYDGGDTFYAVNLWGVRPDVFLVAGIILAGAFVLLISVAAMRFMGRFMVLDEEKEKHRALLLFWFPVILLNGAIAFLYSLSLPQVDLAYPLINSAFLLLLIGTALLLVPVFSESDRETEYSISMKSVLSVAAVFVLMMAGWGGVFGFSRETAHGLLLADPPVQAEIYYSDYTVGNAAFMVYANGTVRAEMTLRNRMESPSPLESKIYHTFDRRPDWDRYVARSRNMLATMFDLPRGVSENLTFATDYDTVTHHDSRMFVSDGLGRRCVTYFNLSNAGTRQYHAPGEQAFQPGMGVPTGDVTFGFADPWAGRGGYLDMVTVRWEEGLEIVDIQAWNQNLQHIPRFREGNSVVWTNINIESSPSEYKFTFRFV